MLADSKAFPLAHVHTNDAIAMCSMPCSSTTWAKMHIFSIQNGSSCISTVAGKLRMRYKAAVSGALLLRGCAIFRLGVAVSAAPEPQHRFLHNKVSSWRVVEKLA